MADLFRDDGTTPVCSAWLNEVDWAIDDALGSPRNPTEARINIGAVGEAPSDGVIYGRQNGAWTVVADSGGAPVADYIYRVPTSANLNKITVSGNPTFVPLAIEGDSAQDTNLLSVTKVGDADPLVQITKSGGFIVGPYSALDGTPGNARSAFTATENAVGITTQRNTAVAGAGLFRVNVGNSDARGIVIKLDDAPVSTQSVFEVWDSAGDVLTKIRADGQIQTGEDVLVTGQALMAPGADTARVTATRVNNGSVQMLLMESDVVGGAGRRTLRYIPAKPDAATNDEQVLALEYNPGYSGSSLWPTATFRTNLQTAGWAGNLVLNHGKQSAASAAEFGHWSIRPGEYNSSNQILHFRYKSGVDDGSISGETLAASIASTGDVRVYNDLRVEGDINYIGTITDISDAAIKRDIADTGGALDTILSLRVRDYFNLLTSRNETGLVAQEVQPVMPQLVQPFDEKHLGVSYHNLIPYLVKAIQELAAR
jgi:hypothetical protein